MDVLMECIQDEIKDEDEQELNKNTENPIQEINTGPLTQRDNMIKLFKASDSRFYQLVKAVEALPITSWDNQILCPHCKETTVFPFGNEKYRFKCPTCNNECMMEKDEILSNMTSKLRHVGKVLSVLSFYVNYASENTSGDELDRKKLSECEEDEMVWCKLCLKRKAETVVLPCNHLYLCEKCGSKDPQTCMFCQTPIHGTMRIEY